MVDLQKIFDEAHDDAIKSLVNDDSVTSLDAETHSLKNVERARMVFVEKSFERFYEAIRRELAGQGIHI